MIDRLLEACEGKKHLIFDFDETIFWIHPDRDALVAELSKQLESLDSELTKNPMTTSTHQSIITDMIKKYGSTVRTKALDMHEEFENKLLKPTEKYTEIIDFIKRYSNDYRMHIWSSNHTETFMPYLEKYSIKECFDTFVGMDTIELIKQYPDGFYHIHSLHGGEKKDYLMIGNSKQRDGGAAESAGIDYFFIDSRKVDWIRIEE